VGFWVWGFGCWVLGKGGPARAPPPRCQSPPHGPPPVDGLEFSVDGSGAGTKLSPFGTLDPLGGERQREGCEAVPRRVRI